MTLFRIRIYSNYFVNVYADGNISDIFEKTVINDGIPDCYIKSENLNEKHIQRLLINREVMLKYKDNWVLHSVSCKLKTGINIVICGDVGSGKSYFYRLLVEKGLVEKLYDEDLIGINNNGVLFSLAKANFKGNVNGDYVYDYDKLDFGKIDLFVIMGSNFKKGDSLRYLFINSIIHNSYKGDKEVIAHYERFPEFSGVKYFYVPPREDQEREDIIYSVINDIGSIERKFY